MEKQTEIKHVGINNCILTRHKSALHKGYITWEVRSGNKVANKILNGAQSGGTFIIGLHYVRI